MTTAQPLTVEPGPWAPAMYQVISVVEETGDTVTLTLEPVDRAVDPPAPGQFCMLWAFGVGEAPISLAGRDGARLVHTVRRVGPVTRALCEARPGTQIGVRGPYGRGWEIDRAGGRDVLIVAGGLGVAPVRPLVLDLLDDESDRRRTVLLGAKQPDQLLYRTELDRWRAAPGLRLETTVDVAPADWRGNVGLVTGLLDRVELDAERTVAYVCGPEVMMWFVAKDLQRRGLAPETILVSVERNMHCAIGHCGHCQLGPAFICHDGPVLDWSVVEPLLAVPAL